jgi:hypothetical protein
MDWEQRGQQLHLVVVGDQGQLIDLRQPAHQEGRALLGHLQLGAGHGAGPVDDQGQVKGRPRAVLLRGRRYQLEHGMDGVLGLHGQKLVFQSNVRLHGSLQSKRALLPTTVCGFSLTRITGV